jgi:hypothetical protein
MESESENEHLADRVKGQVLQFKASLRMAVPIAEAYLLAVMS